MHLCLRQKCRPAFPTKRAVSSRKERHVDLHVCVRILLLIWNPQKQHDCLICRICEQAFTLNTFASANMKEIPNTW